MRKNFGSWPLALAVFATVGLGYQSLFSKVLDGGIDWFRHFGSSYGESGYHLNSEYKWQDRNGFPTSVFVFEANELDHQGKRSILVLLKDQQHREKSRIYVAGGHRLLQASLIGVDGKYLELIIQTTPEIEGLECQFVDLESGHASTDASKVTFSRYSKPRSDTPQF